MGAMNAVAVPLGAFPMCHGSGGVAGKFAFGARTAGANVVLGVGYVLVALLAVGLVATFPTAVLGVVLAVVALQLAHTAIAETGDYLLVGVVAVVGLVLNLGIAFALGIVLYHARSLLR
jgi:MFS superfamily sulfate permease-like transporter